MRDIKEIGTDIKAIVNNYLKTTAKREIEALDEDSELEQGAEIDFLERNERLFSLIEWLQKWCGYLKRDWHMVCVWIINQGYINDVILSFELNVPRLATIRDLNTKLNSPPSEELKQWEAALREKLSTMTDEEKLLCLDNEMNEIRKKLS